MTATTGRGIIEKASSGISVDGALTGAPRVATIANDHDPPVSSVVTAPASSAHRAAELRVDCTDRVAAIAYVQILVGVFSPVAETISVIDTRGRSHDHLDVGQIGQLWGSERIASIRMLLILNDAPTIFEITPARDSNRVVFLRAPLGEGNEPATTLWLQASPDHVSSSPIVALPIERGALAPDAPHGLIGLAGREALVRAELRIEDDPTPLWTWSKEGGAPGVRPLRASSSGVAWKPGGSAEKEEPAAWCTESNAPADRAALTSDWWLRLDELTWASPSLEALATHLLLALPSSGPWRLVDLPVAPPADFMVPPEEGVVVSLVPADREVLIAVDLQQAPELLGPALLHAIAHVALGHVRPRDRFAHWDTAKTITAPKPHRAWDQEVKEYLARAIGPRPERRVTSLEQCNPSEKAQLGLWRMIGEMLGESRRLHPEAERYQRAAYQRRAAERLVSMLEDYGGAMLCDGVGLGKTYVATTLIVHYALTWRDAYAAMPERGLEDPFRITILAPHSVVSTWRREALPPLSAFGVPQASLRVISHTQLSRVSRASELLAPVRGGPSDLEHLLLSDLVIVDEAHNFRSLAARRTKVLRDLLRLQPRREIRRRVVLLTATPINNSLEDLRQEVSLLFSRPLWLGDGKKDAYRRQATKQLQERLTQARAQGTRADVAPILVHGRADAKFSDSIDFRDDLDFGPNVQRIGDYLQEQDKRLKNLQDRIRTAAQAGETRRDEPPVRIAEDLLDRIVVQRSRALCKDIERQQGGAVELLFRPDASAPEKLPYSDEYDGIEDVLRRFLPLFDSKNGSHKDSSLRPLTFKVYMWYDVRTGLKSPEDTSSVIGLQRVLALKRLESSPVSFLITLVRLTVLHAHRLEQLGALCHSLADHPRRKTLEAEIDALFGRQDQAALAKLQSLAAVAPTSARGGDFLKNLSAAYVDGRPAADTDDPPPQLSLFDDDTTQQSSRDELHRLWALREALLSDFETLLRVTPELTDIVFGRFERSEWPRRFIAGGEAIDWPTSANWGLRLVTDAKLRKLVGRLVTARRAGQKVVVFSQFSDTIAYIQSVLRACKSFSRVEWQMVVRGGLGVDHVRSEELTGLLSATATVTGATEDRDDVVNAFAPFYRIGPARPAPEDGLWDDIGPRQAAWDTAWEQALTRPVDVLLSTDVLAEGVNLQDAALLVNFDVHWNPVRMIQRAGRIDRRLNPRIEHATEFPDLTTLASRAGLPAPRYYWHAHRPEAPATVNMILPDELEAELLLRERLATKTLAIDFTLGLEQGTGAEADWMADYKYKGITSLNSFQKDRAIEQISGHHERLSQRLQARGIQLEWAENLNGWFRTDEATTGSPLVARALLGRRGGTLERFSRYLEPTEFDGVPYWFWAEKRPGESMYDGWLVLDGRAENFPPRPRRDMPYHENVSTPVRASHLLAAAEQLAEEPAIDALSSRNIGRLLLQGASALAAPKLGTEEERRLIALRDFFLLQLPSFELSASRRARGRSPTIPPVSNTKPNR